MPSADWEVEGMSCSACAGAVREALEKHPQVKHAEVAYNAGRARVQWEEIPPDFEALEHLVAEAGYQLRPNENSLASQAWKEAGKRREKAIQTRKKESFLALAISVPIMATSMWFHDAAVSAWWGLVGAGIVLVLGRSYFIKAWQQLKNRYLAMDTLIALSTGMAYFFSAAQLLTGNPEMLFFESAAFIMAFVMLGKYLEEKARASSLDALSSMAELEVTEVRLHPKGQIIPLEDLKQGQAFMVSQGARIPADGEVLTGQAEANEQWFTGESEPVLKTPGAKVLAGSLLINGQLVIKAHQVGKESSLNQTMQAVLETLSKPAPAQRLADRISARFVPGVLVLALGTFFLWTFLPNGAWWMGLKAALTVLAVACPCALGLATPTAISVAVGLAAKKGAIIQKPEMLEWMGKTDLVFLDKTGTLTEGRPKVSDAQADSRQRALAGYMAQRSVHPAAQAVAEFVEENERAKDWEAKVEEIPGKGLQMQLSTDEIYLLGKPGWAAQSGWPETEAGLVVLGNGTETYAWFALESKGRKGMPKAIKELKQMGITPVLLTGDRIGAAREIADPLGIQEIWAEHSPSQKAEKVRAAKAQGHWVLMVGDGINDAEALSEAQMSIAMQEGSGLAVSSAGMRLPAAQLPQLPNLIRLGKKTRETIRQNLAWAFLYNLLALPIAAGALYPITGYLMDPMWAGLAMALSSVSVVANSIRLRFSFRNFDTK